MNVAVMGAGLGLIVVALIEGHYLPHAPVVVWLPSAVAAVWIGAGCGAALAGRS